MWVWISWLDSDSTSYYTAAKYYSKWVVKKLTRIFNFFITRRSWLWSWQANNWCFQIKRSCSIPLCNNEPVAKRLFIQMNKLLEINWIFFILPRIVMYWLLFFLISSPIIRRYQGLGRKNKSFFFLQVCILIVVRQWVEHIHFFWFT